VDAEISGVWADNAEIDEPRHDQQHAARILEARRESGWHGLYFGGVAFKHQREVSDLERAARTAAEYMEVVTTSGPGTGRSASREKIAALREGLADAPLAIASGITPENVSITATWRIVFSLRLELAGPSPSSLRNDYRLFSSLCGARAGTHRRLSLVLPLC
jgi:hypothetical protein